MVRIGGGKYQSLGNVPLSRPGEPPLRESGGPLGRIPGTWVLDGLLNHYRRKAA